MILFIAEGIGFGHVKRSSILMDILSRKGYDVSLLTDEKLRGFFDADFLPISANLKFNKEQLDVSGTVIDVIKRNNLLSIKQVRDYILEKDPDLIIVDTNIIGLLAASLTEKKIIYLTNNNDFSIFAYNGLLNKSAKMLNSLIEKTAHKILIPDFEPPYTISYYNLVFNNSNKYSFIGPLAKQSKKQKTKKLLLSFGKDSMNHIYKPLINLCESNFDVIKAWEVDYDTAYSASYVLTHGGHTTIMEAIVNDIPLLFSVLKYQERLNNAKRAEELGIGKLLDFNFISKETIEFSIENLPKFNYLKKLADKINLKENILKEVEGLI